MQSRGPLVNVKHIPRGKRSSSSQSRPRSSRQHHVFEELNVKCSAGGGSIEQ